MLSDYALTWWRVQCRSDPDRPVVWEWEDFIEALRDYFVDKDRSKRALVAFERWDLLKGETIPAYVSRFE